VGRALGKEGNASGEAALDALAAMVVVVPLFGPGGGPPKRGKKSTAVTAVLWGLVGQHVCQGVFPGAASCLLWGL